METKAPTDRFTGLAAIYDRARPGYPADAWEFIIQTAGLLPGMTAVDVGCGTGISARQLAAFGINVVGVEPNDDMRQTAEVSSPGVSFRRGVGDATGLPDQSADLILAAQAFHWFPTNSAIAEFIRIVRPGGWIALMWNERNNDDSFTAEYSNIIWRWSPEPALAVRRDNECGRLLLESPLVVHAQYRAFAFHQIVTREQLIDRAFSVSYAPHNAEDRNHLTTDLADLFQRFEAGGSASLRYWTAVYIARRPGGVLVESSDS